MTAAMSLLNGLLSTVFDVLLYPFRSQHPLVGLTVVSAVAAVLMLLAYRATSNQAAIEKVKRQIAAGLFEIRLYNDDMVAILRAQGAILRHNFKYMGLNLVPMVWMLLPFVLVVAQLQFHYGYEGLAVGRSSLLTVRLSDDAVAGATSDAIELEQLPSGIRLDSPRVWIPSKGEAAWRIVAEQPGNYSVRVNVLGNTYDKTIVVSDVIERRSPNRLQASLLDQLLYPAEAPLPGSGPVAEIALAYPDRTVGLFGFEGHWLIAFLILSIAIAFALKDRFGVTI